MSFDGLSQFLQFVGWKQFAGYFLFISEIPESYFQMRLLDDVTLAASIVKLEGLANFVSHCLLGQKIDDRFDTMVFNASQWATVTEADDKQTLLGGLKSAYEQLQHAILNSSTEQLTEEGRPMWQPGGMSSPAEAVLTLAFISTYQQGQLSCLLKEFP
jgi:hypothetical protein